MGTLESYKDDFVIHLNRFGFMWLLKKGMKIMWYLYYQLIHTHEFFLQSWYEFLNIPMEKFLFCNVIYQCIGTSIKAKVYFNSKDT